jgi:hypothetical protein
MWESIKNLRKKSNKYPTENSRKKKEKKRRKEKKHEDILCKKTLV